jgi:hypothetical protein
MGLLNEQAFSRWGVHVTGHEFDLADWEETLTPPSEPWMERSQDNCILRWSGFDDLQEPSEVHARAEALVEQLNGVMAVVKGSRPVRVNAVVRFDPEGTRQFNELAAAHLEIRTRMSVAEMRIIGPDGAVASEAAAPPRPSDIQLWATIADTDDHLADALVYFGRGGWFDLFKAIECIEDYARDRRLRRAGHTRRRESSETALLKLGWIEREEFKRLKRTVNSFRHRRGGTHGPPPRPVTPEEAWRAVAMLLRRAFETAAAQMKL